MVDPLSHIDEKYMQRCLQLAACGRLGARPNPMVGAVITVPDGNDTRIIGEGYHRKCGEGHAEVNAFASVSRRDEALLPQATMYVSLEPCSHWGKTPPCADLIINKGVRHVVVGCTDSNKKVAGRGIGRLREAGIRVDVDVMADACRWLNRRFFTFHELGRPYIILKWAQSADGFIDNHFMPYRFSNAHTLRLSHRLRAEEDAIVVGHTTWQRDTPQLTVRHWWGSNPVRFVLEGDMTIETLLHECVAAQLQSLIVEGGAKTHQAFLDAQLWDELRVETAPISLGGGTRATTVPQQARHRKTLYYADNRIDIWVRDKISASG